MTMPDERTRAVLQTREFLYELKSVSLTPGVPDTIRQQAITLLRHYPDAGIMAIAGRTCPDWFAVPE